MASNTLRKLTIAFIATVVTGAFALAVIVFGLTALTAWISKHPDEYLPLLTPFIKKHTGLNVRLGEFHVNTEALSALNIKARHIIVFSEDGVTPVLKLETLSFFCDASLFYKGRFVFDKVLVDALDLTLNFSEDGKILLGDIALVSATPSKSSGALNLIHIVLDQFNLVNAHVQVNFPKTWKIPTFNINDIQGNIYWTSLQKHFELKMAVEWGGDSGTLQASAKGDGERWNGVYQLKDFPLHQLVIPKVQGMFDEIPVKGLLGINGKMVSVDFLEWESHFDWNITQGQLLSSRFPKGQMPLETFKGKGDLMSSGGLSSFNIGVEPLAFPFGNFTLQSQLTLRPDQPPLITMRGKSSKWKIEKTIPYLTAFFPKSAAAWIRQQVHSGTITSLALTLDLNLKESYKTLDEILQFSVSGELSDVSLTPFEGIPVITKGAASFKADLAGLSMNFKTGQMPGVQIEGGTLKLGYGENTIPMHINAFGQGEGAQAWPEFRTMWNATLPWLNQLEFEGRINADFTLDTPDLSGPDSLDLVIKLQPLEAKAMFHLPKWTYQLTEIGGELLITLKHLQWTELKFRLDEISGTSNGIFPLDDREPLIKLQLLHLESLFPYYEDPDHEMSHWFPEKLNASLTVKQDNLANGQKGPWEFELLTEDSSQQQLQVNMEVEGDRFKITNANGDIGQFHLQGQLNLDQNKGKTVLQMGSLFHPNTSVSCQWENQSALIELETEKFIFEEWQSWKIPLNLTKLIPPSSNDSQSSDFSGSFFIKELQFNLNINQLYFFDQAHFPVVVTGFLNLEEPFHFNLSHFQIGSDQGNAQYTGNLQSGQLALNLTSLDVPYWLNKLAAQNKHPKPTNKNISESKIEAASDSENQGSPAKEFKVSLKIEKLKLPGNRPNSFESEIHLYFDEGTIEANIDPFRYGSQSLQAQVVYTDNLLDISLDNGKISVLPWLNLARAWPPSSSQSAPTASQPSLLKRIQLNIQIENLVVAETLKLPLYLTGVLDLEGENMELVIDQFRTPQASGKLTFTAHHSHQEFNAKLTILDIVGVINGARYVDWGHWLNSTFDGPLPEATASLPLNFKLDASKTYFGFDPVSFHVVGKMEQEGENTVLLLNHLEWDKQSGALRITQVGKQTQVSGNFKYLNLAQWRELSDSLETPEEIEAKTVEEKRLQKSTPPFSISLPEFNIKLDLSADRLKFLESTFNDFKLKAEISPDKYKISRVIWRKKRDPAFSLVGYLKRQPNNHWVGKASMDVFDLGDLLSILAKQGEELQDKFPLELGKTHFQADLDLVPISENLWLPHAKILGESYDGIIAKGGSLLFLVTTLSIQSYFKAVQGELSGFEGKGYVYNSLNVDVQMKGGRFEVFDLSIKSPTMNIVASGIIDANESTQELLLCLQPFETLDKVLDHIPLLNYLLLNKRGAFYEFCFQTKGVLDRPLIFPLPQSVIPGRLRDFFLFDYEDEQEAEPLDEFGTSVAP
ncbi:AsmA-like C-terminal domain-containing protein [Deltaproteobacteria bacterium TL4]